MAKKDFSAGRSDPPLAAQIGRLLDALQAVVRAATALKQAEERLTAFRRRIYRDVATSTAGTQAWEKEKDAVQDAYLDALHAYTATRSAFRDQNATMEAAAVSLEDLGYGDPDFRLPKPGDGGASDFVFGQGLRLVWHALDDERADFVSEGKDLPLARKLEKALERARSAVSSDEAAADEDDSVPKGVSLLDAAMILNDADEMLALQKKKAWQRMHAPPLPNSIGNCPEHRQRKLYAPSALADFVEKVEGKRLCTKHKLRQRLTEKARKPRQPRQS